MNRIFILMFVTTSMYGCVEDPHPHLVCEDGDGKIVVNTRDLSKPPRQYPAAWSWKTVSDRVYHEISIPPHSCHYEQHPAPDEGEDCGCPLGPGTPEVQYAEAPKGAP